MKRETILKAGSRTAAVVTVLVTALMATACSSLTAIGNIDAVSQGRSYQSQYRSDSWRGNSGAQTATSEQMNAQVCASDTAAVVATSLPSSAPDEERLSPGDLLKVLVGDDDTFSGNFEVSQDGSLNLPYLDRVRAQGRKAAELEQAIADRLVENGFYRDTPRVSVRAMDFAAARVSVSGAVFEAGTVIVGGASGSDIDGARQDATGGLVGARRLSRALQSAGGVRPDAELSRIVITRGSVQRTVDMRPALVGQLYNDVLLVAGDLIEVPSRGCFQEDMMRPTPITAPGVKVFMSNLTQPADATSVGKDARELRYGTRFIQAVVGMNCVGGSKLANANRTAVLYTRNPVTGNSVVIERDIESLLRRADRDDFDPFILPGDALACYDSGFTDVVEVAKGLSSVSISAALLVR